MMQQGEHTFSEELVVESADTPKQHEALAGYDRGKSAHMRLMAAEHRSVVKAYKQDGAARSHATTLQRSRITPDNGARDRDPAPRRARGRAHTECVVPRIRP